MTNFDVLMELHERYPILTQAVNLIPGLREDIVRFAKDAVAENKETCAKVAEGFSKNIVDSTEMLQVDRNPDLLCTRIAIAIRALP